MSNLLSDIRADILDCINRPQAESQDRVDRAINKSIRFLMRKHQFTLTERFVRIAYPANALTLNVADILDGKIRDIISVQLVSSPTGTSGKFLRVQKLSELFAKLNKQQRLRPILFDFEEINTEFTQLRENSDYSVFLMNGEIGLYPTPTSAVTLLLAAHAWLRPLENDDDTNFFLDFCDDYIVLKSLYHLNTVLKMEGVNPINSQELADAYEACLQWDSQLSNSPGETI
jgi:hypothetical protein